MIELAKGRIRTFLSIDAPELEDLLALTGDMSTLVFVNTVDECEKLMKLSLHDVRAAPAHVFIGGFLEEFEAKCEAARNSAFVSHHQVIPMDDDKAMSKVLRSVLFPPRPDFLDVSLIVPTLHVQAPLSLENRRRLMQILYSEIKPRYIVTQAVYRKQKLARWQRRQNMELDDNFDNALRSLVTARPTVDCMYAN